MPEQLRTRPFTLDEARRVGLTSSALRGPEWRRLFRTVWVHRSVADTLQLRVAAVALVLPPDAVVCGLTAAWLHGADVRREGDLAVHVAFPRGRRRRSQAGLVVSQETLERGDLWQVGDVVVTSPVRTAYDCLRMLRGAERLVVADALTQLRRTSADDIRTYFETHRRRRNVRTGQRLVDDIEPKSESPMETRVRAGLVASGLPRPVAQWEVRDADGRFVARLDLAYPEAKVAVEYDGAWHWKQRRHDDRRRDAARRLGWYIVVVSAEDYYGRFDVICRDVADALRTRLTTSSVTRLAE